MFTNNRTDFFESGTYNEEMNAFVYSKGIPNRVTKGLEISGTTITNGYFVNGGTFGQLGAEGETQEITANYTGYLVIKSTLQGNVSKSELIEQGTREDTEVGDTSNIKYFTIYHLTNGVVDEDFTKSAGTSVDVSITNNGTDNYIGVNVNGVKDSEKLPTSSSGGGLGTMVVEDIITIPSNQSSEAVPMTEVEYNKYDRFAFYFSASEGGAQREGFGGEFGLHGQSNTTSITRDLQTLDLFGDKIDRLLLLFTLQWIGDNLNVISRVYDETASIVGNNEDVPNEYKYITVKGIKYE